MGLWRVADPGRLLTGRFWPVPDQGGGKILTVQLEGDYILPPINGCANLN